MTTWRGLTWDHPRGYAALERAAAETGGIINWARQPLEGFESAPIEDVCAGYDLVVLDHPHLGDAMAAGCLRPIDSILPPAALAAIRERTLGPCYSSYEADGHLWALPLDAAAQVSAGRMDLMEEPWPVTYDDLLLSSQKEAGFVMSLAGPHAFVSMLSLCAGFDRQFGSLAEGYLRPHHDEAIAIYLTLAHRSRPEGLSENPIGILRLISKGALSYCPLIFGYVPYAAKENLNPVIFRDAPRKNSTSLPCGVLGGTGIAVTANCKLDAPLIAHLEALMSVSMQQGLIPSTSGQPSAEAAWLADAVNAEVTDFYRNTVETLRHSFQRPRHQGFVPTQTFAAEWLRGAIDNSSPQEVRVKINALLAAGENHA